MERALRGGGSLAPSVGAGGYVTTAAERTVLFAMIQGAQTVKAVCEQTGNWATTVSSTVRHLFEKGWISKLSDPVRTKGRSAAGYAVTEAGGVLIVTADHGNCERMLDEAGDQPHTAHTMNLVPVLMVNAPAWVKGLRDGRLSDVAPTILGLMGIEQPAEMTGRSLIAPKKAATAAAQ